MPLDDECDVLIIGGGPAGSTAAALLAERGADVVLLEKDEHPRFHIGESLLPRNVAILERLGVRDSVAAIGVYKPGAEFVSDETGERVAFPFALANIPGADFAYQVCRSEFDQLLFETARARGARARCGARVIELGDSCGNGRKRVIAETPDGPRVYAPRFVLDASGRDAFMAAREKLKQSDKRNNTAAVFAHFRGVETRDDALRGYISVHLAQDGWFWFIPLPGDVMSVGFVGNPSAFRQRRGTTAEFLERRIRESRTVSARMECAERISDVFGAGNYSYRARRSWGDGWLMIGDAFAFIDPVFSSGVLLAMTAGEMGAETAAAWLADPRRGAALARRSERRLCQAMDRIGWLIYRINRPVLRQMFMSPSNAFGMRDGLVSMLAGHLSLGWRARLPVLAFKAAYYMLTGMRRLGMTSAVTPMLAPPVPAE